MNVFSLVATAFTASAAAVGLLYLLCYLGPRWAAGYLSIPYAFHVGRNFGGPGLDFQTVIYETLHRRAGNDGVHHGLVLDQIAWFTVAWLGLGWAGAGLLLAVLLVQTASFGERGLGFVLATAWLAIAVAAGLLVHWVPAPLLALGAQLTLMGSALLRVLAHGCEPVPPLVLDGTTRFRPLDLHRKLIALPFVGYVAELAAGLPFRLFPPLVHLVSQRLGLVPRARIARAEARALAAAIHHDGWEAYPVTRRLFTWVPGSSDPHPAA